VTARCLVVVVVLLAGCAPVVVRGARPEVERIGVVERARGGVGELLPLARDATPAVRARVALALGRMAAPGSPPSASAGLPELVRLMADPEPRVRRAAAFAMGIAGDQPGAGAELGAKVEALLLARLAVEPAKVVRPRLVRALGYAGSTRCLQALMAALRAGGRPGAEHERRAAGEALVALGVRGVELGARVEEALAAALRDPVMEVRRAAATALARAQSKVRAGPGVEAAVLAATADADGDVRSWAVRAAGALGARQASGAGPVLRVLEGRLRDRDWRVPVEALRALGRLAKKDPRAVELLLKALRQPSGGEHAAHVLLDEMLALSGGPLLPVQAAVRESAHQWHQALLQRRDGLPARSAERRATAELACLALQLELRSAAPADGIPSSAALLRALSSCAGPEDGLQPWWLRAQAARAVAFAELASDTPLVQLQLLADRDARVAAALLDALAERVGQGGLSPATLGVMAGRAAQGLMERDPGVVNAALGLVAAVLDAAPPPASPSPGGPTALDIFPGLLPIVLPDVARRLDSRHGVEAQLALIPLLARLQRPSTRKALLHLAADPHPGVRAAALKALGPGVTPPAVRLLPTWPPGPAPVALRPVTEVTLYTTRGRLELVLWPTVAPAAVASFVDLARQGFFSGLTFHRVVPDFVVQGGDPRGDGFGGPGYSVPCEVSDLPFERGAVGIALAGKDTGGSQLFLMHTAAPHLDGRYPLIGRVTAGLEVMDALTVGDRILEVRIGHPVHRRRSR
jgi:cyclophilin family peptidyl-prolyl cis-trans isomerase/HEAT repeat protein